MGYRMFRGSPMFRADPAAAAWVLAPGSRMRLIRRMGWTRPPGMPWRLPTRCWKVLSGEPVRPSREGAAGSLAASPPGAEKLTIQDNYVKYPR